jgi:hypothetical protein
MRVVPGCGCGLIDLEDGTPSAAWIDELMGSTVTLARNKNPVPVRGCWAVKSVFDDHLDCVSAMDADHGPKDLPRITKRLGWLTFNERVPARFDCQLNGMTKFAGLD